MSSRFSEDNRAGAEIFSLVPSVVVKHYRLRNLAEKLQFWQQDFPTLSSLLSELKEWQYFWKQYTPTYSYREILSSVYNMLMRICTPTYEFYLLLVVPFLLVLPKLNVHSLACDELSHISETGCLMSSCQDLHSCTYIMTLTLMLTKSVQSL